MSWLLTALSTTAFSTAALALALWLFKSAITTRLTSAVRHEYDRELEALKADLANKASQIDAIRSGVLNGLHSRQALKHQKALDSAEAVWVSTVKLGNLKHLAELFTHFDPDKMAAEAAKNPEFRQIFQILDKGIKIEDYRDREPDNLRIYASPLAWSLYSAYRSILLNAFARLQGIKLGVDKDFTKTAEILNTAKAAVPQHSELIDKHGFKCLYILLDEIESSLLIELKKMIDGDESDQESINKAARINAAVEGLNKSEVAA